MSPKASSFELTYKRGDKEHTVEFDKPRVVLGRASTCDVVFADEVEVSRHHAQIEKSDNCWYLTDLDSRNKTFVNNEPLRPHEPKKLRDMDTVNLGPVKMTFRLPTGAPPSSEEIVVLYDDESPSARPNVTSVINMEEINKVLGGGLPESQSQDRVSSTLRDVGPRSLSMVEEPKTESHGAGWVISLFSQVGEALLRSENLDDLLQKVLELAFSNLPAQRGFICLYDEETDTITPKVTRTASGNATENIRFSRSIANHVIKSKEALLVADAYEELKGAVSIMNMQIRSAMCTPLYHQGRVNGMIYVDTQAIGRPFSQQDLQVLTALAVLSAVGIEQTRLREDIVREQRIRETLGRYSSPSVVKQIVSSVLAEGMLADTKVITVLFCDLCGFTTMSEGMPPTEVTQMLNGIFERLTDAIFQFDGTLDKFMGDALMAFFGAPLHQPDHAERAVRAALLMLKALEEFNNTNVGRDPISMRIGINSGQCVAGDIGSPKRKDYTVIGDTVNVASRLESSVAKPGQIVIGPTTYELVRHRFVCQELPEQQLKGRQKKVRPYLVIEPINSHSIHRTPTEELYRES